MKLTNRFNHLNVQIPQPKCIKVECIVYICMNIHNIYVCIFILFIVIRMFIFKILYVVICDMFGHIIYIYLYMEFLLAEVSPFPHPKHCASASELFEALMQISN